MPKKAKPYVRKPLLKTKTNGDLRTSSKENDAASSMFGPQKRATKR